jgi:AAA domain
MGTKSSTAQPRMALDAPGRAAPSPQHVLEAMKSKENDFETHHKFVTALASIKVGLGPDCEEYYADVEQWALGWPENTPDYVRDRWDSIGEASIGWSYFEGLARAKGYQTQEDFKEPVAPEYMPEPEPLPAKPPVLSAAPTIFGDPAATPMRQWVYDNHYIRRFLSTTIAPGGVGKTKLIIAEVLAMVTGKPLLGVPVPAPVHVIYWNLEDPLDELMRQFQAAMKFYGITNQDIGGRLVVRSARDYRGLKIATEDRGVVKLNEPVIAALRQQIIDASADVVIFDPFVSIHSVPENDNNKIDEVCKALNELAEQCNCAIEATHHSRKFSNSHTEVTADDGRGASAMNAAARSVRVLNLMSKDEAERADVDNRYAYFRVDNGKANLAPRADRSTWRRLISIQLGNGDPIPHAGDEVGVVAPWEWPAADGDVTPEELKTVFAKIEGGEWRKSPKAKNWVGNAIAEGLGLDPSHPAVKAKVRALSKNGSHPLCWLRVMRGSW